MSVTFPPYNWAPNPTRLVDSAATLLAVAGDSLDQLGFGQLYGRRAYSVGAEIPWWQVAPTGGEDGGQLLVTMTRLFLGRPGEEEYRRPSTVRMTSTSTAQYTVQVVNPWPVGQGSIALSVTDEMVMDAANALYRDAYIVWTALGSAAVGGPANLQTNPPISPLNPESQIVVGPMQPRGPLGGQAAMTIEVQVPS